MKGDLKGKGKEKGKAWNLFGHLIYLNLFLYVYI